jgi:hypothetical protein
VVKKLGLCLLILAFVYSPSLFAQGGATGRIRQSIVINGQAAEGVYLIQNGVVQGATCSNPQPYETVDGSSSGYACFDVPSGTWLLSAQPVYTQPNTVYVPSPTYSYSYPDSYSYPSYSYPYYYPSYGSYYGGFGGYPYWSGLGLGLGFAFGNGFHNHYYNRGFYGHNRAFVRNGRGAFVGRPAFNGGFRGSGFRGGAFRGGGFHGGGFRGGGFHGGGFRGGGFHGGGFRGGGFRGGGFHGGGGFRGGGGGFRGGGRR